MSFSAACEAPIDSVGFMRRLKPPHPSASGFSAACLLARHLAVRLEAASNQAESANEENQHHDGVEEAERLEIDMEIGNDAGENKERAGNGEKPPGDAAPAPEQDADAEEHGQEGDSKSIVSI